MKRYEVFDWCDGRPVVVVPWEWLAKYLTIRRYGWDYARPGDGWHLEEAWNPHGKIERFGRRLGGVS